LILKWKPSDRVEIRSGYGYAKVRNLSLVRYPEHQIKSQFRFWFLDQKLMTELSHTWNNKVPGSTSRDDGYSKFRSEFDLAISYKANDTWSYKLSALNLLGTDDPTTGYSIDRPLDGHIGDNKTKVYLEARCEF